MKVMHNKQVRFSDEIDKTLLQTFLEEPNFTWSICRYVYMMQHPVPQP